MPPKKPGRTGRPKSSNPRATQIAIRLTADERALIEQAAGRERRTPSAWMRLQILDKIRDFSAIPTILE